MMTAMLTVRNILAGARLRCLGGQRGRRISRGRRGGHARCAGRCAEHQALGARAARAAPRLDRAIAGTAVRTELEPRTHNCAAGRGGLRAAGWRRGPISARCPGRPLLHAGSADQRPSHALSPETCISSSVRRAASRSSPTLSAAAAGAFGVGVTGMVLTVAASFCGCLACCVWRAGLAGPRVLWLSMAVVIGVLPSTRPDFAYGEAYRARRGCSPKP